ncbi:REP-associated tyrosine transposase [Endothiovibrio diazotrophicus]
MSNYRRHALNNRALFVTVVTAQRAPILGDHVDALRTAIGHVQQRHPFNLPAAVILPDHCHLLMELPEGEENYSLRIRQIKERFTRLVPDAVSPTDSRLKRRERGVWQRRFWEHQIRDEEDFRRHLEYIHYNPVKHGYVGRCRDWPYSSFERWVQRGVYALDWAEDKPPEVIDKLQTGE